MGEARMALRVKNSGTNPTCVTLFGRLADSSIAGDVMALEDVPKGNYWPDAVDQVVVRIYPEQWQLEEILKALNEGRLAYEGLRRQGGPEGGISEFEV